MWSIDPRAEPFTAGLEVRFCLTAEGFAGERSCGCPLKRSRGGEWSPLRSRPYAVVSLFGACGPQPVKAKPCRAENATV